MSTVGDWDPADALGHEPADPEQVAAELHRLRAAHGLETVPWEQAHQGALVAVAAALLTWLREQGAT